MSLPVARSAARWARLLPLLPLLLVGLLLSGVITWINLGLAAAVALLGLGFYMLHTTLVTVATQLSAEARGQAVASFGSCSFIGQGIGAGLGGLVVDGAGTTALFLTAAPLLLLLGLGFAQRLGHRPAG